MRAIIATLLLVGCQRGPVETETPGARLESAAVARGLIADPARAGLVGSWAGEADRVCIVPNGNGHRIGIAVDYGEGQGCVAAGTIDRAGERLRVRLGDCVLDAEFDGERIAFPSELPGVCARFCTGRATLSAVMVDRLSGSASEASMVRAPNGRLLCGPA